MIKKLINVKEMLYEKDLTLLVMKDNEIIYSSNERGIKPIFELYKNNIDKLEGAVLADRVFGKAAAEISKRLSLEAIYTELISENALKVLDNSNIILEYDRTTENILNRDKSDLCPVEKISLNSKDFNDLIKNIEEFLIRIEKS